MSDNDFMNMADILLQEDQSSSTDLEIQSEESEELEQISLSPTLQKVLDKSSPYHSLAPSNNPACLNCPSALWMILDKENLQCYCRGLKSISWKTSEPIDLPMCDGMFLQVKEN